MAKSSELKHEVSGNDLSALIPDGPYVSLKKKKRFTVGQVATGSIISIIGRRPLGDKRPSK